MRTHCVRCLEEPSLNAVFQVLVRGSGQEQRWVRCNYWRGAFVGLEAPHSPDG